MFRIRNAVRHQYLTFSISPIPLVYESSLPCMTRVRFFFKYCTVGATVLTTLRFRLKHLELLTVLTPAIQHDCTSNCKRVFFKEQKLQKINFVETLGCPNQKNTLKVKNCWPERRNGCYSILNKTKLHHRFGFSHFYGNWKLFQKRRTHN